MVVVILISTRSPRVLATIRVDQRDPSTVIGSGVGSEPGSCKIFIKVYFYDHRVVEFYMKCALYCVLIVSYEFVADAHQTQTKIILK